MAIISDEMCLLCVPRCINIDEDTTYSFSCRDVLPPLFCLSSASSARSTIRRAGLFGRPIQGHHVGVSLGGRRLGHLTHTRLEWIYLLSSKCRGIKCALGSAGREVGHSFQGAGTGPTEVRDDPGAHGKMIFRNVNRYLRSPFSVPFSRLFVTNFDKSG